MSCMGEKEKGGGSGKADPLGTGSGRQVPDKIFGPETTQVQDLSQYARATGQLMVEDRDNKQDEEFQS